MELYRPIGGDWFLEGFWRIAESYNNYWVTVNQFLSVHQSEQPADSQHRLNPTDIVKNGVYHIGWQRAIELQTFKEMEFDYIVASIPLHYREFTRLRNMYQPNAKVICQVGNQFDFPFEWATNIMSSTKYTDIPPNINKVFYHQEFSLEDFHHVPMRYTRKVSSFLHQFSTRIDYPLWKEMRGVMGDWEFKQYGSGGTEAYPPTDVDVAEAMRDSDLIVHFKEEGDGFGHIVHNVFAVGRALLTKKEYYEGQMPFDLMLDGETCLFWRDDKTLRWNVERILSHDLEEMGEKAHRRFTEIVDYDKEELLIRDFLKRAG